MSLTDNQQKKYRAIALALDISIAEAEEVWKEAFRDKCGNDYDDFCEEFRLEPSETERKEYVELSEKEVLKNAEKEVTKHTTFVDAFKGRPEYISEETHPHWFRHKEEYRPGVKVLENVKVHKGAAVRTDLGEVTPVVILSDHYEDYSTESDDADRRYATAKEFQIKQQEIADKYTLDELFDGVEEVVNLTEEEIVEQEAKQALDNDLLRSYETRKNSVLESKYKSLLKSYGQLEDRYAESLSIPKRHSNLSTKIKARQTPTHNTQGEATPILLLSDWHVGEYIEAGSVNGENSFNQDIAQERAEWLFKNAAKLIRKEAKDVHIKQAVVWLGGDFISNYIHPELMETNTLSPTEEIYFAQELITNGINYLLENTRIEKLVVPTSVGNHGRTTIKTHIATATQNSLEQLMYRNIKRHYSNTPEVEFLLSDGYLNYLDVYGKTLRFAHGDAVRGGAGVGGITIPLLRWIGKTNANRRADMDFLGHFHSVHFNPQFTINGSLCGANAYSTRLGCKNEVAKQALLLLDRDLGFTYNLPVFCFDTSH